jgi:glycosyltransferase involved in cell wall biosynthesis
MKKTSNSVVIRKARTAAAFLMDGGVYGGWSNNATVYSSVVRENFQPDIVWATYLPTDSLVIALRLSRICGVPWAIDIKDSFSLDVPFGLRKLMAIRFRSAAVITANASMRKNDVERWFGRTPTIIYSGFSEDVLVQHGASKIAVPYRIMLIGGVYSDYNLREFFAGLRGWIQGLDSYEQQSIRFVYAGSDAMRVEEAAQALQGVCACEIHDYLATDAMLNLCKTAWVNCYLWLPTTFHHKVIELLACRRPILSFPGEGTEAIQIAASVKGTLMPCHSPEELASSLDQLWKASSRNEPVGDLEAIKRYSWESGAEKLESALQSALPLLS